MGLVVGDVNVQWHSFREGIMVPNQQKKRAEFIPQKINFKQITSKNKVKSLLRDISLYIHSLQHFNHYADNTLSIPAWVQNITIKLAVTGNPLLGAEITMPKVVYCSPADKLRDIRFQRRNYQSHHLSQDWIAMPKEYQIVSMSLSINKPYGAEYIILFDIEARGYVECRGRLLQEKLLHSLNIGWQKADEYQSRAQEAKLPITQINEIKEASGDERKQAEARMFKYADRKNGEIHILCQSLNEQFKSVILKALNNCKNQYRKATEKQLLTAEYAKQNEKVTFNFSYVAINFGKMDVLIPKDNLLNILGLKMLILNSVWQNIPEIAAVFPKMELYFVQERHHYARLHNLWLIMHRRDMKENPLSIINQSIAFVKQTNAFESAEIFYGMSLESTTGIVPVADEISFELETDSRQDNNNNNNNNIVKYSFWRNEFNTFLKELNKHFFHGHINVKLAEKWWCLPATKK